MPSVCSSTATMRPVSSTSLTATRPSTPAGYVDWTTSAAGRLTGVDAERRAGVVQGGAGQLTALVVERLQLRRRAVSASAGSVGREEALGDGRLGDPAGGVQARPEPEGDVLGLDPRAGPGRRDGSAPPGRRSGGRSARAGRGARSRGSRRSSGITSETVPSAASWNRAGSSRARAAGSSRRSTSACATFSATPAPASCLNGYGQSGAVRIDDRDGGRELGRHVVVVGDDDVQADRVGGGDLGRRRDAAVDGDDQPGLPARRGRAGRRCSGRSRRGRGAG